MSNQYSRLRGFVNLSVLSTMIFFLIYSCSYPILSFGNSSTSSEFVHSRIEQMTKGINVSHWFAQVPLTPNSFESNVTARDIHLIQEMGFRHIRLPLDPDVLFSEQNPRELNAENLKYFDSALDMIIYQKLSVVVAIFPKASFKKRLYSDPGFVDNFALFWTSLAKHLSQRNPDNVFLEAMNEPSAEDPQIWNGIQSKLLSAMRSGAPNHTLIASSNLRTIKGWDELGGLEALVPIQDKNVVYNFHFYQPKIFVSQGAKWAWKDVLPYVKNVPYPSSFSAIEPLLLSIDSPTAKQQLRIYGEQNWNVQKLESLIQRASIWANSNHVYLTCNEFGVYRSVAPPKDRNVWIKDVRSLLEKYQIGWSMWGYEGGFGVTNTSDDGVQVPDQDTLNALFGS